MIYIINNGRIDVDFEAKKIVSMLVDGRELIKGNIPFFSVRLRKKNNEKRIITAFDCTFLKVEQENAYYTHEEVDVVLSIRQSKKGLLWRINVKNKTKDVIELVDVMSFGVGEKLRDEEGGYGALLTSYNEGALITDMTVREQYHLNYHDVDYPSEGSFFLFPNMLSSQFMAYLTERGGVYLGLHDQDRTLKNMDFCYGENCTRIMMRPFCDVDYGQDYEMPFDGVMTFFEGEWQDACEIYKQWFEQNLPTGVKKIVEQTDLPSWYGESPIIVAYPVLGRYDTDEMIPNGLFPYENALPSLKEISDATNSSVMALIMHWEGTAPWAPPYVWPPYGGEEVFASFLNKAHAQDMLVGLYCSGFGWTQKSNLTEYSREKTFIEENIADAVCANSNGEYYSVICTGQRNGFDMCPAVQKTKDIFQTEISKVCASGVDYIQVLDQNHGGTSYFCYSDKHGHVPAPGKWQVQETAALLDGIERNGALLGCESAAAEPYLAHLKFSDNRFELNYFVGIPVPVYSYLYHEYVNNFMGNQVCTPLEKKENSYPMRVAYSFLAGDMLTAVIVDGGRIVYSWGEKDFTDKENALTILKNLNAWRKGLGKNYLHVGKMIKPLAIECGKESFKLNKGTHTFVADEVLTAAYEYKGQKVQFVVNYNTRGVQIRLPKKVDVILDSIGMQSLTGIETLDIPPLSAVMMKL